MTETGADDDGIVIETIDRPPEAGPHEELDAPPFEERDPSDR